MEKKKNIFKELSSISVKDKIEKKGQYSYLSWANAWTLVKLHHPTAQRTIYESEHTGLNFFSDGKTAYVKVGITIDDLEHIDYLPVMDYRNNSILLEKLTSMDVNTAIQRSTAKACAMHGLGLSLWIGEDITTTTTPSKTTTNPPHSKTMTTFQLDIGDENWGKVLKYVAANRDLGLPKLVKNLEVKYKIKANVKKELSKHLK